VGFWRQKISGNVQRDAASIAALHTLGWRTAVLWDCSLEADIGKLVSKLRRLRASCL
jgi:DNA mismatch endonuclease (patch repair protein)